MKTPRTKRNRVPDGYVPLPVCFTKEQQRREKPQGDRQERLAVFKCQGILQDDCTVVISAAGDIAVLYKMGFFGKGSLSKHAPTFNDLLQQGKVAVENHILQAKTDKYTLKRCSGMDLRQRKVLTGSSVSPTTFVKVYSGCDDTTDCQQSVDDMKKIKNVASLVNQSQAVSNKVTRNDDYLLKWSGIRHDELAGDQQVLANPIDEQLQGQSANKQTQEWSVAGEVQEQIIDRWANADSDEEFWLSDSIDPPVQSPTGNSTASFSLENSNFCQNLSMISKKMWEDEPKHQPKKEYYITESEEILSSDDEDNCTPPTDDVLHQCKEDLTEYENMSEELILEPCEAMFLVFTIGCLNLVDKAGAQINFTKLWQLCLQLDPIFVPKYAVYHHLRSKGWIVKSALMYGADYVIYWKGPPYYHSSFGIIIRCCDKTTLQEIDRYTSRKLTWAKLMGLNRVINNVRKELITCYVLMPAELSDLELSSPRCIEHFTVCECLVSRIVPSRERDCFI